MSKDPLFRPLEALFVLALLALVSGCSGGSGEPGAGDPASPEIVLGAYLPDDGLIVVEFESGAAPGAWATETAMTGFTGSGYLTWTGPNLYTQPGVDVFGFDLWIDDPGRYHFRLHNRHDHPDSTLANDLWVRLDGGDWVKAFSWERGVWTWATQHEFSSSNKPPAEYQLTAGNHRIEFSGRSTDFSVDRLHLYLDGRANPLDTSHPESQRFGVSSAMAPSMPSAVLDPSPLCTTLVELDGTGAEDVAWRLGAGAFADGTGAGDALARVVVPGGVAVPVERTLEGPPQWTILHPADAPLLFGGEPVVGGLVTVGGADEITVIAPDGRRIDGPHFTPDHAGLWTARTLDGARELGLHVLP